jgi:hypothetical protein
MAAFKRKQVGLVRYFVDHVYDLPYFFRLVSKILHDNSDDFRRFPRFSLTSRTDFVYDHAPLFSRGEISFAESDYVACIPGYVKRGLGHFLEAVDTWMVLSTWQLLPSPIARHRRSADDW